MRKMPDTNKNYCCSTVEAALKEKIPQIIKVESVRGH